MLSASISNVPPSFKSALPSFAILIPFSITVSTSCKTAPFSYLGASDPSFNKVLSAKASLATLIFLLIAISTHFDPDKLIGTFLG